jgi:hypothetical protein
LSELQNQQEKATYPMKKQTNSSCGTFRLKAQNYMQKEKSLQ